MVHTCVPTSLACFHCPLSMLAALRSITTWPSLAQREGRLQNRNACAVAEAAAACSRLLRLKGLPRPNGMSSSCPRPADLAVSGLPLPLPSPLPSWPAGTMAAGIEMDMHLGESGLGVCGELSRSSMCAGRSVAASCESLQHGLAPRHGSAMLERHHSPPVPVHRELPSCLPPCTACPCHPAAILHLQFAC